MTKKERKTEYLVFLSFSVIHCLAQPMIHKMSQYVQSASDDSNLLLGALHWNIYGGALENACTASFAGKMLGCDSWTDWDIHQFGEIVFTWNDAFLSVQYCFWSVLAGISQICKHFLEGIWWLRKVSNQSHSRISRNILELFLVWFHISAQTMYYLTEVKTRIPGEKSNAFPPS